MDTGVERIVDQVVNPKLNSNFVPKIEDVAYKYLGIEKQVNRMTELEIDTKNHQRFMPNLDLEQVSPESEKCPSVEPPSPKSNDENISSIDDHVDDIEEKMDDLESPAFEPIECKVIKDEIVEQDDDKMDICLDDSEDDQNKSNGFDEAKSNLSSISGLTSNDDSCETNANKAPTAIDVKSECVATEIEKKAISDAAIQQFDAIEQPEEKPSIHYSNDVVENLNQDSVLSQVSSNSRLSIITNNNTDTRMDDADADDDEPKSCTATDTAEKIEKGNTCPYDISEEAQMQRFNESSSSSNSLVIDTDNVSNDKNDESVAVAAFDINKEEIKFEGTERKSFDIDLSETKEVINEKHPLNGGDHVNKLDLLPEDVAKTSDVGLASSTETSLNEMNDNTAIKVASSKIESTSNDASSTSSKNHKESKSSSSASSSYHRNGADLDSKKNSKDRHGASSSSSSRHRGHSDRSKRSHSSGHSSISKDKMRNSRGKTDGKHRESDKRRSDERPSKNPHHTSRSSSSKNRKDKERSRSDKKDSTKYETKNSENKKSRSDDTHRSSRRDKDDHASHKGKLMSRKRSSSKDSNDGSANQPSGTFPPVIHHSASTDQTTTVTSHESGQSHQQQTTSATHSSPCSASSLNATTTHSFPPITTDVADNDFVLTTQPVVIDQILSGQELNLESFVDENRDNPLISTIEQTLADHARVKKPKVAANIHEARKLMKVRKRIDREEQKKLEQARVLAKQYMRSNLIDDSQGVELEFACMRSGTNAAGPSISSPVKFVSGNEQPLQLQATSPAPKSKDMEIEEFQGFSAEVSHTAKDMLQQFEAMKVMLSKIKRPMNSMLPSDQFIELMAGTDVVANVLITPKAGGAETESSSGRTGLSLNCKMFDAMLNFEI